MHLHAIESTQVAFWTCPRPSHAAGGFWADLVLGCTVPHCPQGWPRAGVLAGISGIPTREGGKQTRVLRAEAGNLPPPLPPHPRARDVTGQPGRGRKGNGGRPAAREGSANRAAATSAPRPCPPDPRHRRAKIPAPFGLTPRPGAGCHFPPVFSSSSESLAGLSPKPLGICSKLPRLPEPRFLRRATPFTGGFGL